MKRFCLPIVAVLFLAGLAGCASPGEHQPSLRLIGVQTVPSRQIVAGTVVGGLSGIDYDAKRDRWVAISDDRSEASPARAYTLRLDYDDKTFSGASVEAVTLLRQPDGSLYPDKNAFASNHAGAVPDFESVRLDPRDGSLWYASEGDRRIGLDIFVRQATRDGRFLAELPLPERFRFQREERGPRNNLGPEGLSFSADGDTLWTALEGPRYEDGEVPTPEKGAWTRFTHYARDGRVLEEFGYPLDAIPAKPVAGQVADNGVSEILALGDRRFLVLERAGVPETAKGFRNHIRLYLAKATHAADVKEVPALRAGKFRPLEKTLLLNFDQFTAPRADNLEGLAWGRRLANGHATLVLIADDNFSPKQSGQIWVFEVIP